MINFFKKKENKNNNNNNNNKPKLHLSNKFPWISNLDKNFVKLSKKKKNYSYCSL